MVESGGERASVVQRSTPGRWESPEAQAELRRGPDQRSCTADADCAPFHGAGYAPPAVCCDGSGTGVTTRAYVEWVARFRARFCGGVQCETPTIPGALPGPCFFEGRCVNGQCATACNQAPR